MIRRCLELYQDELGRHDLAALKEAATYVPHAVNQLSMTKGFSPQQWVFGKTMTLVHGLSGEIFNPGQEALDEQGAFADVQRRRADAAKAFIAADSDAKLRRAFTQKFQEQKEDLVVGQQCWYWRNAGAGILRKSRWRGPARVVAIEEVGDARVLWLCHGTSLIRCAPAQVRPLVEETGTPVPSDRGAAVRDLEELRARSTTQFRDEMRRAGIDPSREDIDFDNDDLEADYSPSVLPRGERPNAAADADELLRDLEEQDEETLPGIVQAMLPRLSADERERTPRRRTASDAPTAEPPEPPDDGPPVSPKRRQENPPDDPRPGKTVRPDAADPNAVLAEAASHPVPEPGDDELVIDDVFLCDVVGKDKLPEGWKLVDGSFELDEIYLQQQFRKGEVNMRLLDPDKQAEFVSAKCGELENYFGNHVWEFATEKESKDAVENKRVITARWVLTWKRINEDKPDETPRYKAKARLVLRGFEDPDLLNIKTASPTASRLARLFLLTVAVWKGWIVFCGDVKAAFLSGSGFDRVIIVRLPKDCNPLLGFDAVGPQGFIYMRLKKSAYRLADAPLLWYREACARLTKAGWRQHPLDQCCFLLVDPQCSADQQSSSLLGLLIIHVDDVLLTGDTSNKVYQAAVERLKRDFQFGKWETLSKDHPLKYCGGQIYLTDSGIEVSYSEYMSKILPVTVPKGRKPTDEVSPAEVSKSRALIGALQWPSSQGLPMLSASVSLQAGAVIGGTIQDILDLNKTLRFGKAHSDVNIKFIAKPKHAKADLKDMTLVCYADAAFCTRRDRSSQGGYIILACDKSVHNGEKVPASTISWRSFKLPRVCRSSLAAECQATATALEEMYMAKTFLEVLKFPMEVLKNIKDNLSGPSAMVTDCKALYDAVYRETIQQATDKRVAIEGLVIKDTLRSLNCTWR